MRKARLIGINQEDLEDHIRPLFPDLLLEDLRASIHQAVAMGKMGEATITVEQGKAIEAWLSDQIEVLGFVIGVNLGLLVRFVKGNDEDLSFRLWGLNLDFIASWFLENADRFRIAPHIVTKDEEHVEIGFSGLCPAVRFWISPQTATVSLEHEGECWDLLADFDLSPEETADGGWVNSLAVKERQVRYPDLRSMWINECALPLVAWCEKNLVPNGSVWLFEHDSGGMTWAKTSPTSQCMEKNQVAREVAHWPLFASEATG